MTCEACGHARWPLFGLVLAGPEGGAKTPSPPLDPLLLQSITTTTTTITFHNSRKPESNHLLFDYQIRTFQQLERHLSNDINNICGRYDQQVIVTLLSDNFKRINM